MSLQQLAILTALGVGVYFYSTKDRTTKGPINVQWEFIKTPEDVIKQLPVLNVPGIAVDQSYLTAQREDILNGRFGFNETTHRPGGTQFF